MAKNLNEFLEQIQSLTISSLDENGYPFSSYAPLVVQLNQEMIN